MAMHCLNRGGVCAELDRATEAVTCHHHGIVHLLERQPQQLALLGRLWGELSVTSQQDAVALSGEDVDAIIWLAAISPALISCSCGIAS